MSRCFVWAIGALLLGLGLPARGRAHESRPLYVEIEEQAPGRFSVQWRTPPSVPSGNAPEVQLPEHCELVQDTVPDRRMYACAEELGGDTLRIRYPAFNPSVSTLVRWTWRSGQTHTFVGSPDQSRLSIPVKESAAGVARQYLRLGVGHILAGYDHLLFLVCLLLIAGTGRRIFWTITGFTLAHSLTLALSALGWVRVPVAPVEASIALSIVFVAWEILRGDRDSLAYRHPIAISSAFGLLHGFGFAAVLSETGLPQTEIPTALLFFNLGVEIGQLLFILGLVLAYQLVKALAPAAGVSVEALKRRLSRLERPLVYAVGSLAAFWMIQRVASFWAS